jgi:N-acetylmuramoyl-L-alanine amidase
VIIRRPNVSRIAAFLVLFAAVAVSVAAAENISPLGKSPDWRSLEKFQDTITRDDFTRLMQTVYCTRGAGDNLLKIEAETASILINKDDQKWFTLRFAKDAASAKPLVRSWRPASELAAPPPEKALEGVKIAIDPGHIGGSWAQMEERWFQVGDSKPVTEGDMTLLVAKILALDLEKLGAQVSLVRKKNEPVTSKRPADLKEVSKQILRRAGIANPREDFSGPDDPLKDKTVRWQSEILFYRNSEIRARAELVNTKIEPDVVLCLHFNAEAWDDPRSRR